MTEKLKLLFFPYAGGSSMVYSGWKKYFNDDTDIIPVDISGRGKKMKEPFHVHIKDAAIEIFEEIREEILEGNYAFFGHSMATLIVFETMQLIKANNYKEPLHVFLSGRNPPHLYKENDFLSGLTDQEFVSEILKIGGTPAEFFKSKELMKVFVPILKADYRMVENYEYELSDNDKFNCNITFLFADEDYALKRNKVIEWRNYTNGQFNIIEFKGNHFFLLAQAEQVCKQISNMLILSKVMSD